MRSRLTALVVLAAAVALGSSGCSLISPQSTTIQYAASDGVNGSVGEVDVRNALIITSDKGLTGNLVVTLINNGDSSHSVEIGWGAGESNSTSVVVDAGSTATFGAPHATGDDQTQTKSILIDPLEAKPGSTNDVFFQYGTETGVTLTVPVLTGELEAYSTLVPTPSK